MTQLKKSLRLSAISAVQGDANTMIETATNQARLRFFDYLGSDRINAINAITFVEAPTTSDQYTRLRANQCEILIVRVWLLRTMPVLFRDDRSTGQQSWNEEGLTRDISEKLLAQEIDRLETEINEMLEALGEGENDGETSNVKIMGRPEVNSYPGAAVFASPLLSGGDS